MGHSQCTHIMHTYAYNEASVYAYIAFWKK